ncbi:ABC-type sugar transport system ATPase subunit [Rhizobium sp. BK008]|nr:ABC-type sugar transport system ATPase subunit [Rhizobium sp. BK008]
MSPTSITPALSVRNAQKRFGAIHALKNVSFDAYSGEVTALLGDNGAGKSTLVKCISGLHSLDEGEIWMVLPYRSIRRQPPAAPASKPSIRIWRFSTT